MEKPGILEKKDRRKGKSSLDHNLLETFEKQIDGYEREKNILLALSNDITKVRDKNDLLVLFSSRIKSIFYFNYAIITLINEKREYYSAFLLDHDASVIRNHPAYPQLIVAHFDLN